MKAFPLLAGLSTAVCVLVSVSGATWYVGGSVSSLGDGKSWVSALKTIQEGIEAAGKADAVIVAESTFVENDPFENRNTVPTGANRHDRDVAANSALDGRRAGPVAAFDNSENPTYATLLAKGILSQIRAAARRGGLSLNDAKALFETSTPRDFAELPNLIPVVKDGSPQYHERFQYQVFFGDPPESQGLQSLRDVGLQIVTVVVSWPADEPDTDLREKVTFVTFVLFPTSR